MNEMVKIQHQQWEGEKNISLYPIVCKGTGCLPVTSLDQHLDNEYDFVHLNC